MSTSRSYQSPLREAQAALTAERILMTAKDYLERHDIESLTLRRVARLSDVSAPTVYAHFPTMDDLVGAFFHWLKPRLALDRPLPPLDRLHEVPALLFPRYEAHGALLRNLMNKPSWDRQRLKDRGSRHGGWIETIGAELPGLTPEQLRRAALSIASYWGPTHWRWLRDTCGYGPEEARRVAAWGIQALVGAVRRDPSGLDFPAEPTLSHQPEERP
ncbi:transcriptional regulator, TetR family [Tistlia consotensis]|uniref:Transcriptional regulator, TetR family n=1 Tax=Tistlia consotensis USBA 355 TaxID=560819 RepID=A0A1Y6C010_9PROT|nr:helix-turn-helix domain-containing protein [Tistlia consotensis]SMF38572.1 transcriptional regulator, TetR family [Tistlia consotensis USBA 355]SNR37058.1 transcriptional regulator, TetR family [Tistlia consotensis]